jgi:hypothetical protein
MFQYLNSLALPQRSFREGAEQIRVRMVHRPRNRLQPLTYDFGYFRHL